MTRAEERAEKKLRRRALMRKFGFSRRRAKKKLHK